MDKKPIVTSNFGTAGTVIVDEFLERLGSSLSDFIERPTPDDVDIENKSLVNSPRN